MLNAKTGVVAVNLAAAGALVFVLAGMAFIPLVSPENGEYTTERRPEFTWGGMQGEFVVSLDDDPDFRSPLVWDAEGNSHRPEKDLDFGTYYWKVESSSARSEVREFTIDSSVVLARDEEEVRNEGNADILLYRITGAMVVDAGGSVKVGEEENVEAEQA